MDPSNFVISTRNVKGKGAKASFGNEPDETRYLEVPNGKIPHPINHRMSRDAWVAAVLERAATGVRRKQARDPRSGFTTGDVLVFVHGYNNSMRDVMIRHDLLQQNLSAKGYEGAVVSFDWPSAELTLGYLEDRNDALATSRQLVDDGIRIVARNQALQEENECDINVHLLGHSTGAYVIREGFYLADKNAPIARINWQVSQIALIGGDIARSSLSRDNGKSQSLFNHAVRITNYENPYDSALKASNIKRAGTAPRVGRVGLPDDHPENVVSVNVGDYWKERVENARGRKKVPGNMSHSWHFGDDTFAEDLVYTLAGDIDRHRIPTREMHDGVLRFRV